MSDTRQPLPPEPGQAERFDYQHEREGVNNLFRFFEPLKAWRQVAVTEQRTSIDYAQQMKYLVDERYPEAEKIRVVQDNLNTHVKASSKILGLKPRRSTTALLLNPIFRTLSVTRSQERKKRESKYLSRGISWRQTAANSARILRSPSSDSQ